MFFQRLQTLQNTRGYKRRALGFQPLYFTQLRATQSLEDRVKTVKKRCVSVGRRKEEEETERQTARATRQEYLDEREAYFRTLPEAELDILWSHKHDLHDDEQSRLRGWIRHVKGIRTQPGVQYFAKKY